jgi:heptose I phosphotransferase
MMQLRGDFQNFFHGKDAFDRIMNIQGEVFRQQKNRRTLRILKDGKGYFIKIHRKAGWQEILKNLINFKWPVLSAQNELHAIKRLEELGIKTMRIVGSGIRGFAPAGLDSFIITEELENTVSLENLSRNWPAEPPDFMLKMTIIKSIADIARCLHQNGVNHRDFYICHFLIDITSLKTASNEGLCLYLIDLHRVQLRKHTPRRWRIKDLSGLFFSSMDTGLTKRDVFRFMKIYCGKPLRTLLKEEAGFWESVQQRAVKLYEKEFQRLPKFQI